MVYSTANLVLMDTVERLQSSNLWAEVPRGLFLIRGENVVLLGEIVSCIHYNHERDDSNVRCA